ncbi:MFS transporter [Phyllobacterium myrsinacearum]|uniref:MFS transporter n=1 Tax=Phyllobacterium myrsinacearum TaxID=28101 RepID=UPI0024780991|nr:MFS transporter [Phyllobacterium myrsinacearum]
MGTLAVLSIRRPALIFIFITVLLDVVSMGVVVPVLPQLVLGFLGNDFSRAADLLGVFISVWAFSHFIASPVVGGLSDHFGRRPIILLSNLTLAMDHFLMAFAPALWVLFIGRALSGICSATVSTAYAYISDVTPGDKRAGSFAVLSTAFGLGFVVGPAIGGFLGQYDIRLPFLVAALLGLANFIYGLIILPESLAAGLRVPFSLQVANPLVSLRLFRRSNQLSRLGFLSFIMQMAQQVLPACAVLYMTYRYQWQVTQIGMALAYVGAVYIAIQSGVMRPLSNRVSEKTLAIVGFLAGTIGLWIYGVASAGVIFLAAIPIMEFWSLAQPSIYALMTKEVDAAEQGRLQGANSSVLALAGLLGPGLFAKLFAIGVNPEIGLNMPGLPFFVAAALMLLGLLVVIGLRGLQGSQIDKR